jgi:hypothetical protein
MAERPGIVWPDAEGGARVAEEIALVGSRASG